MRRMASASVATWSRRFSQFKVVGGRISLRWWIAGRPSCPLRSMCLAKFTRAPGNHTAPGITRFFSTHSYAVEDSISKYCHCAAQKSSTESTDHCQSDG